MKKMELLCDFCGKVIPGYGYPMKIIIDNNVDNSMIPIGTVSIFPHLYKDACVLCAGKVLKLIADYKNEA